MQQFSFIPTYLKFEFSNFLKSYPPPLYFSNYFFISGYSAYSPVDILKVLLLVSRELSNPEGLAEDQRDQMYCLLIEHAKRLVQTKYGRKFIYGKHILFSKLGL